MSNLARLAEASLDRHGDYPALYFEGAAVQELPRF